MRRLLAVSLLLVAAGRAGATPAVYRIEPGDERNLVRFVSKAPLETVAGETRQVTGEVRVDPAALAAGCLVEVQVDLASLDTGIGLRNQHMRENHLETARFPTASFRADSLIDAPGALAPGATVVLTLAGELSLHGVTRPLITPVSVSLAADGAALEVRAEFTVKLADFAIPRPKFLVMKLDELQHVSVQLSAQRAGAEG